MSDRKDGLGEVFDFLVKLSVGFKFLLILLCLCHDKLLHKLKTFNEIVYLALLSRSQTHARDRWFSLEDRVAKIRDHDTGDTGFLGGLIGALKLRKILSSKSNFDTVIGLVERDGLGAHFLRFEIRVEIRVPCLSSDFTWGHIEIATNYGVESVWIGIAVHAGIRNLWAGAGVGVC